jgi:predicted nucleic acid-binding Zn ribbon protein
MTATRFCTACGAALSDGARFCHQCGRGVEGSPGRSRGPVLAAGTVVVAAVVVLVVLLVRGPEGAPPAPGAAPAAGLPGRAPDISAMTPREQFDRLFDRVTAYARQGDVDMVIRFTEHALAAYAQLPGVDAEARYRAGLLYAGVGQYPAALALADTITAAQPGHPLAASLRERVEEARRAGPGGLP